MIVLGRTSGHDLVSVLMQFCMTAENGVSNMNNLLCALAGLLFGLVAVVGVINHPDAQPNTPHPADIDAIGQLLEDLR